MPGDNEFHEANSQNQEERLSSYRLERIEHSVRTLAENMNKLVLLEERHQEIRAGMERAFNEIKDHNSRLTKLELEMPVLRLTRNWIIGGMAAIAMMVFVALMKLVVIGASLPSQ